MWEQGLGPPAHSSLSGWGDGRLCSQASWPAGWGGLCIPDGELNLAHARAWAGLTHAKCSLGVQLKALRTANLIFFCKEKGEALREPVTPVHRGLALWAGTGGSSGLGAQPQS